MKLTYFPVRGESLTAAAHPRDRELTCASRVTQRAAAGRAEPLLLLLKDSGIDFEEEIITSEVRDCSTGPLAAADRPLAGLG